METSALRFTRWFTHILLALTVAAIFHAGWRLRRALGEQSNVGTTQLSVSQKLDELTQLNPFRQIGTSLSSVQTSEAEKQIKALNRSLNNLEKTLHITPEPLLTKTLTTFSEAVQENASFSHPPELLNTLSEKATALRMLSQSRNWKNLLSYSTRLETRLRGLRQTGRAESPQVRYAESDIASMERLTRTSSLDEGNKQEVLRRLEGLRQEISMLSDVHDAGRKYQGLEAEGREGLARWLGRARLAASALKTAGERRLQGAVQELWIVGAFVLIVWGALSFLWAQALRAQRHAQDQGILEVLRDGLLNQGTQWRLHVGEARLDEVERTLRTARKRMSLGDDVQSSLPFGAMLINASGKVVWSNTVLSEEFQIDHESIMEEDFNWEQIRRRITGAPPTIIEKALSAQEGGTWQVQVEVEKGVCLPYEMHVSPINGKAGEAKKVLVVFYSMVMMREAITDQARLVASPMRAAIQALENGAWSPEMETRLAPLWSAAGLGEDWSRLSQAVDRLDGSRRELLAQVERQENTVHDQAKMIQELEMGIDRRIGTIKDQVHMLKELRDGLISLDGQGQEMQQGHTEVVKESRAFMKRTEVIRENLKTLSERLHAAKDSVASLERIKHDYKAEKQEITEAKMDLMRSQNRFIGALPPMNLAAENMAAVMKDNLLRLDEGVTRLDSRLAQLDVQITKISMACAGQVPESEKMLLDLTPFEKNAAEIQRTMQEDQEHVVKLLRELVEAMRQDQHELTLLREGAPAQVVSKPENLYPFI